MIYVVAEELIPEAEAEVENAPEELPEAQEVPVFAE